MPVVYDRKGIQPLSGIHEVAVADDVVAVEDASGFVTRHLHCDPLGNPGPHQISNRCPPQIVRDASGQPRLAARRQPGPFETLETSSPKREHSRGNRFSLSSDRVGFGLLASEQTAELVGHRKDAPLAVLRGSRIQPHRSGLEVHVTPLER
jgi:hypothetical protein